MTPCPICKRLTTQASIMRMPYVYGRTLALTLKLNPDWKREDGMCRGCLVTIIDTVVEHEERKVE